MRESTAFNLHIGARSHAYGGHFSVGKGTALYIGHCRCSVRTASDIHGRSTVKGAVTHSGGRCAVTDTYSFAITIIGESKTANHRSVVQFYKVTVAEIACSGERQGFISGERHSVYKNSI